MNIVKHTKELEIVSIVEKNMAVESKVMEIEVAAQKLEG